MDREHTYFCFKCGDEGFPVKQDENRTLGLCACMEGWYVGNITQLCDYLNETHQQLEDAGLIDYGLEEYEYNEDDEDLDA